MSSAIGLSSPTRNQASIPLTQSFQGVQDFSKFDAAELSGYVEAEGSSSFRASVKLSIVKNGAGTYEVAASDIAGDDVSGAPLVSFQMTGSLLEAKIDDGVASFSSAVIKFALISPPNSAGSLSVDASSVVSGTIDSARLPKSTAADDTEQYLVPEYREATVVMVNSGQGGVGDPTMSGTLHITKVGNVVTIVSEGNISHTSASNPESADGVIPSWATPTTYDMANVFYNDGNGIQTGIVYPEGKIKIIHRNYSGSALNRTSTTRPFVVSYIVI